MINTIPILATSLFDVGFAWSAHGQNSAAIPASNEKLHNDDITATIARDADALTALWDDDAVLLQPGTPPIVGKVAFHDFMKRALAKLPSAKVLKYVPTSATSKLQAMWLTSGDILMRCRKVPSSKRPKACVPSCFVL